jgi:hypothetical protein
VIVCINGSRDFVGAVLWARGFRLLDDFKARHPEGFTVLSGGAQGADAFGEWWARNRQVMLDIDLANWQKDGKLAGLIRSERMAGVATHLVSFWDGKSRGTAHMIQCMRKLNKPVHVIRYDQWAAT